MRSQPSPHLRPVRNVAAPELQFRNIHGYRRAFRIAGSGPALLLIHGVGSNSGSWEPVHAKLAQRFTVIAPDLLGHGESDKPRADYSLAAFANGMRDLLSALDIDRVTVVGHSYGGGVAMQFAYQFPHLVERVVLVSAGGVAQDVSLALRIAALPVAGEALAMLRMPGARPALRLVGRAIGTLLGSTKYGRDAADAVGVLEDLRERQALAAFRRTLRSVVDARGQFVTMLDRSYLVQSLPVQVIWGEQDPVIPVEHARIAHAALAGSRLEIFEDSGHVPFRDHPDRFVEVVERFIDTTQPAEHQQELLRALLQAANGSTAVENRALAEAADSALEGLDEEEAS
ncbi:alpha/beta hydrolase [Mycobacterium sp.]|uniref:alpha/beta fold hydrolase n=1 Tax=Mycobacterium sp. TaxID=1785 RepID=UPI002C4C1E51|nr:alpha/beta hydrolase [Mycobacterium sp.]HTQ20537.1 alpha/beta hydrolase [Mycobacterium sp.]